MERDFMGLSNRASVRQLKPDLPHDSFSHSGLMKSSAKEWAKFYSPHNFMSARDLHEARAYQAASSVLKKNQTSGLNQNAKSVLLGGLAMTNPFPPLPTLNSFADPRNNVASSAPQLTVFYAGTVNVFNDISPEKAQAIMSWAANGVTTSSMMESPKAKGIDLISKAMGESEGRRAHGKHVVAAAVSASSSSGTHSADAVSIDKPLATKAINLMGSFCAATTMIPSVPQARKASLARFLEKRKERLMNAMPYTYSMKKKIKLMECSTGESSGMNYSATSAA